MIARSWTWREEDGKERDDLESEALHKLLDGYAARWSELATQIEEERWQREADDEPGGYGGPEFDTDEEAAAYERKEALRHEVRRLEMEAIEAFLDHHGARMMRPYEHWNEDEAYMEYMERDRD